jgi:ankyrin repeat protein
MVVSKSGRLSVQTAARCNTDPSLTLYLLKNSSSPPDAILNHQDNSGQTLLQDAVASKNIDLVRVLLEEYKADANVPDKLGRTAVHHAAMIGALTVLTVFHDLHDSQKTVIKWDLPDSWDQWTPLMHAAREGNIECASYLITCCHCDASKKDKQGRTAQDIGEWIEINDG